jgi:hypothetical protein
MDSASWGFLIGSWGASSSREELELWAEPFRPTLLREELFGPRRTFETLLGGLALGTIGTLKATPPMGDAGGYSDKPGRGTSDGSLMASSWEFCVDCRGIGDIWNY